MSAQKPEMPLIHSHQEPEVHDQYKLFRDFVNQLKHP